MTQPPAAEIGSSSDDDDAGLSFDLGGFDLQPEVPPAKAESPKEPAEDEPSLEFDVSSLDDGGFSFAGVVQAPSAPDVPVEEEQGRSLDFDMSPMTANPAPAAAPAAAKETTELDLSEFAKMAPSASASAAVQDDEFSFDMNFDMSGQALAEQNAEAAPESVEVLTDMDEVETKLDLAKAYVDMENPEAAKLMLEEVLQQGDERQKLEAGELLARL
ncbi:FimV/HubP family polar landmark protein [Methylogaea oryzae]|uniref:FimV/HubP family polar landmark protein n=1 Tax=Methylogaea oryzae TaxID=1295382 RepID=UPI0006D24FAE|nr:FimV/HubP family polar landmark protein [Methylogaea oryzae]